MDILKKIILAALPMVLLTGCYTEIDINQKQNPVLCMNAVIVADENFDIKLTRSWNYTDGYAHSQIDINVKDAEIKLYVNDQYVETVGYTEWPDTDAYGNDITAVGYEVEYIPREGDKIKLVANSKQYGEASAEVTVPYAVPIDSVSCGGTASLSFYAPQGELYSDGTTEGYATSVSLSNFYINVHITDPANINNYYRLDCGTDYSLMEYGGNSYNDDVDDDDDSYESSSSPVSFYLWNFDYESEPLFSEHLNALESIFGSDAYGCTFFSDRQISGKSYQLHLRYDGGSFIISSYDQSDRYFHVKVVVELVSLSQSNYNWLLYQWQKDDGLLGEMSDIGFAETLTGYSNVSTGAGVVSAQARSSYRVDLYDFLKKVVDEGRNK